MFYIAIFIVIFFFYYITYGSDSAHSPWALAIPMLALCLVVGMGDMLGGYDRYIYGELFDRCADDVENGIPTLIQTTGINSYHSELAFVYWNILVAHFSANRYIFILFSTIFMYGLIYKSMKDYIDDNYLFAVLVFMGMWFFFSFTYLRQAMAASVAWFSLRYVVNRKPVQFFICVFIAYKFHNSAIIIAPLYFIPIRKWEPSTIIIVMLVLFLVGVTGISQSLYSLYGDMNDDRNKGGYETQETGGRIAYLIEVVLFLYFLFARYDKLTTEKDFVFLNTALCFCAILLFFYRSLSAGRQCWYFVIGFIYIFTRLATRDNDMDIYNILIIVVMFLLFYRLAIGWGVQINPYKTFLTDGYRPGDLIMQKFEYDWKYEDDKMYRKPFRLILGNWW